MRQALSRVLFVLVLGGLACSLTPAQLAPEVIPPTVRPTDPPAAIATLPPTAVPPTALPTDLPTALPTNPPAPTATQPAAPFIPPWPILQVGSQGPNVTALQYLLRHHGQNIAADGIFGPITRQAVITFQTQQGLTADGIVGPQTWPALVQGLVLRNGSSGDAVRAAQQLLYEKFGYLDVDVDGLFGPITEAAVRDYQLSYGLGVDGLIGAQETWPSLISDAP